MNIQTSLLLHLTTISFLYGFLDWMALQVHALKSMFSKIGELFLMFYNFPALFYLVRQKMPKQVGGIMPEVETWKENTEQMKAIKETKESDFRINFQIYTFGYVHKHLHVQNYWNVLTWISSTVSIASWSQSDYLGCHCNKIQQLKTFSPFLLMFPRTRCALCHAVSSLSNNTPF